MPLGCFWASLWHLLALLGACWALRVDLGSIWEPYGLDLASIWGVLGVHLGALGASLGKLGPNLIENADLYFALGKICLKNLSLGTPALPREAPRSVTMRGGLHPPACQD